MRLPCRFGGSHPESETRSRPRRRCSSHPAGSSVFQGDGIASSSFARVPRGQNFRPLILSGCGKTPASTHRSIVRMHTWCRWARVLVRSSSAVGARQLPAPRQLSVLRRGMMRLPRLVARRGSHQRITPDGSDRIGSSCHPSHNRSVFRVVVFPGRRERLELALALRVFSRQRRPRRRARSS